MPKTCPKKTLYDAYRFAGTIPAREVGGVFGDRTALVIPLTRRSKKRYAGRVAPSVAAGTIGGLDTSGISPVATAVFTLRWTSAASTAGSAAP
jgi:hypothetical protein